MDLFRSRMGFVTQRVDKPLDYEHSPPDLPSYRPHARLPFTRNVS